MFTKLKQKAYEEGFAKSRQIGYDEALKFAVEYYETPTPSPVKQEKTIHKNQTSINAFRNLDDFLTWCKCIWEVCDSDFFRSYLFENTNIKEVEDIILYLNYLYEDDRIRTIYPTTYNYIPELIISLHEVRDNKLMLESVNKINTRGE